MLTKKCLNYFSKKKLTLSTYFDWPTFFSKDNRTLPKIFRSIPKSVDDFGGLLDSKFKIERQNGVFGEVAFASKAFQRPCA